MGLWIFHNGQSILNADGIAQSPDSFGAAPKVTELSVTLCIDCPPDNVIMDVRLVYVSADHKGMIAFSESPGIILE